MKSYIRTLDKEKLIDFFMSQLGEQTVKIPVSIFEAKLSSLELIVKYLKEEREWSNKKIALTILRTPQNVWITYRNACRKHPGKLKIKTSQYDLPIDIFDNKLSMLEGVVMHLRKTLSNEQTAKLLHRSPKTITTVYNRGRKKDNFESNKD